MNFIQRKLVFLFLFASPFLAFFATLFLVSFLALKVFPIDPAHQKMASLVEEHFAGKHYDRLYVFNDCLYLVKNDIEKGKIIASKDVEKGEFHLTSPHEGVFLSDEVVIGSVASRLLKADRLLQAADIRAPKVAAIPDEEKGGDIFDSGAILMLGGSIVLAATPLVVIFTAYVWLVIVAFQTSVISGITCLVFSPVAMPWLAMRDWNRARRPFQLFVVGCALAGFLGAAITSGKVREQTLIAACQIGEAEARSEIKHPVVLTLKDLREGQLISADSVTAREIQIDRIPQGAIADTAKVIGKKVRFGMSPNQIVSVYDLK